MSQATLSGASAFLPQSAGKALQVSGLDCFPECRWREAVLYYLVGVWGNRQEVMYRPKIHFGNFTLRLCLGSGQYYAYGEEGSWSGDADRRSRSHHGRILYVECDQDSVEVGLARFVKDDAIGQLTISFGRARALNLRKTTRRGELTAHGVRLPTHEELAREFSSKR